MTIRNVHISLLAVPLPKAPGFFCLLRSSSKASSSSMAFSPAGVAAQPRPSILAIILVEIWAAAGWSSGISGNKSLITGLIFFVSASMSPASSPTLRIPHQKDMIPSIVKHRVTASLAESSAPLVTWARFPWNAPHRIPRAIIPAHR